MQLLLLGDSLLADVGCDRAVVIEQRLPGWDVLNGAMSGSTAADCARQAGHFEPVRPTALLVSLGTNDAVPERRVEPAAFQGDLRALLAGFAGSRCIVLLPPGVDESRQAPSGGRSNAELDRYRAAARRVADDAGAATIDGRSLVDAVTGGGSDPWNVDGVHLTDATYAALAAGLGELLR